MIETFEADLHAAMMADLPCDPAHRDDLLAMDVWNLALAYWNWISRFIPPRRYTVHRSDRLASSAWCTDPRYASALAHIISELEGGGNLAPHLSRRIRIGYQPSQTPVKRLNKRHDLDLLLNDWGMHHLHLSTALDADGFVARTKPLLFAIFKGSDAYLIDILAHGGWAREDLIRTIVRNWPNARLICEVQGIIGSGEPVPEQERQALRVAGIMVPIEIDGKVYMRPAGYTTAGTSGYASHAVNRLRQIVRHFGTLLEKDDRWFRDQAREQNISLPDSLDIHFALSSSGYALTERNSGVVLPLPT